MYIPILRVWLRSPGQMGKADTPFSQAVPESIESRAQHTSNKINVDNAAHPPDLEAQTKLARSQDNRRREAQERGKHCVKGMIGTTAIIVLLLLLGLVALLIHGIVASKRLVVTEG